VLSGFEIGNEQQEQRPLTPATVRKSTSLLSLQFSSPGVKDCSEDWASDSQEYYSDVDSDDEDEERAGVPVPLRSVRAKPGWFYARQLHRFRFNNDFLAQPDSGELHIANCCQQRVSPPHLSLSLGPCSPCGYFGLVAADASASTRSCAGQGPWLALGFTKHKRQFSNSEAGWRI
jgi:hypothetical protein